MASRRYISALNRTLRATGLDTSEAHAALVGLGRVLARRMDAAPEPGPSLRLMSMFRATVKDLQRAAESMPPEPDPKVSVLDEFRRRRRGETGDE